MKLLYQILYRYSTAPWDIGPRADLVELVESGRFKPSRVIDLGCGTGSNCIYLAQNGFQVTGIDFAPAAIELAKKRADQTGVSADFMVDDLTNLKQVSGSYDLLLDYGTFDDLRPKQRELYIQNILQLTHPGSNLLLYAHEWTPKWWERPIYSLGALYLGEANTRFSPYFQVEEISRTKDRPGFPRGFAVYLMTRL
jgi:cyclopropane fatty-acyl-phospholipid synthase-like methyltransferase